MLDVDASQLKAAGARLQGISAALAKQIEASSKTAGAQWRQLLNSNASTRLERRVIAATGKAVSITGGIRLEAGKSGGSLLGGLSVQKAAGPVEYGANRGKRKTYKRRSKRGGSHNVTRHTARQFRNFKGDGYVYGPAVKAIVPKLAKAWTEALRVTITDSIEGG